MNKYEPDFTYKGNTKKMIKCIIIFLISFILFLLSTFIGVSISPAFIGLSLLFMLISITYYMDIISCENKLFMLSLNKKE